MGFAHNGFALNYKMKKTIGNRCQTIEILD